MADEIRNARLYAAVGLRERVGEFHAGNIQHGTLGAKLLHSLAAGRGGEERMRNAGVHAARGEERL